MKVTFKKVIDYDNHHDLTEIEMTVTTFTQSKLIREFENFMRACGFSFDGNLVIEEQEK